MTDWNTPFWPESVSRTVADYHYPIFKLLDDSAAKYPDQVYTIFNGATKTYAQVRNTADRIANFLAAKGIGKVEALFECLRLVHEEGKLPERARMGGFHCFLGVLPWYHSFGITVALLSATASGSRLVCIPDPRAGNPPFTEVLKAVQTYKPTIMPAVPTIFVAFTNHSKLNEYDLSSGKNIK